MRVATLISAMQIMVLASTGCGTDNGSGSNAIGVVDAPTVERDASTAAAIDASVAVDTAVFLTDATIANPVDSANVALDVPLVSVDLDGAAPVDLPSLLDGPPLPSLITRIGDCDYPKCYADLVRDCLPAGSCVATSASSGPVATTSGANYCYENGVKAVKVDQSDWVPPSHVYTGKLAESWKNAAGLCYTMDGSYVILGSAGYEGKTRTLTMRDPAGVPVATVDFDFTNHNMIITCAGTLPVAVPDRCEPSSVNADGGAPVCARGECIY
jgi:hypothetical protein